MFKLFFLADVNNINECHYLTANKDYIVFIESLKTAGSDNKILYQLANMEEIEITPNSLTKFLDDECSDEDDYGIPMTILYTDINNKCGKFQVVCTGLYLNLNNRKRKYFQKFFLENTKTSILNLNYPPLSKTSTFIGGIKYPLGVPKMDNEMISGKQSIAADDETLRSTATISMIFMPIVVIITSLTMIFNN